MAAGIEIADVAGVAGLSMRKLAADLGYEAMSLYNHVSNKDDLLDGMLDEVASEVDLPSDGTAWRPALHALAVSMHTALLRHPWAIELWTRQFPGPHRFGYMEAQLRCIDDAGLGPTLGDVAFHAVSLHVVGFAQQRMAYAHMADDRQDELLQCFDAEVDRAAYPQLVAHKEYHDAVESGAVEHPDEFVFVLDLILDGLERAAAPTSAASQS